MFCRRFKTGVFLLAVFVLSGNVPAHAGDEDLQFQVDGLSCPFCVFGLKKKLGEVEGLKGVEVDYKKGLVRARWDETRAFNEDAIKKAVQDAGFTPGEISYPA